MFFYDEKSETFISPWLHLCIKKRVLFWDDNMNTGFGPGLIILPSDMMALDVQNSNPIRLVINSTGGPMQLIFLAYDVMNSIKSPVYTLGAGCCHSGAALILMAGKPGKRFLLPNVSVQLHYPTFDLSKIIALPKDFISEAFTGDREDKEDAEGLANGEVLCLPNKFQISMKSKGAPPDGIDSKAIRKAIENANKKMLDVVARHCRTENAERIKQRLDKEKEIELSPAECVDLGIADKIAQNFDEFLHDPPS